MPESATPRYRKTPKKNRPADMRPALDLNLENRTWNLWGYVRDHANDLNSDVCCRKIRVAFDAATADASKMAQKASDECERLRGNLATAEKENRRLAALVAAAKTDSPAKNA